MLGLWAFRRVGVPRTVRVDQTEVWAMCPAALSRMAAAPRARGWYLAATSVRQVLAQDWRRGAPCYALTDLIAF